MKRFALLVAGALLVGCSQDKTAPAPSADAGQTPTAVTLGTPTPAVTPAPVAAPTTQPAAPAPVVPTVPAVAVPAPAPAKVIPVYEVTQDNKVYVFATVEAMTDFTSGKAQPTVVEKPNFTPGGKTVVIQAADAAQADEILAGYNKLHPPVAK